MNITNLRNYGDLSNLTNDNKTLSDIIQRQGLTLIVDHIANFVGENAIKWNLSSDEVNRLTDSLIFDLKNAISERT